MILAVVVSVSGWLVVSSASVAGTTEAAAATPVPVGVAAAVGADGEPAAAAGDFRSRKIAAGQYELSFPHEVALSIRSWEHPSAVTVRPVAATTWIVTFVADGETVDNAFTFVTVRARS